MTRRSNRCIVCAPRHSITPGTCVRVYVQHAKHSAGAITHCTNFASGWGSAIRNSNVWAGGRPTGRN